MKRSTVAIVAALTLIGALALPGAARAAEPAVRGLFGPADPKGPAPVELALFEAPFNLRAGWSTPSMSQSLSLTTGAYTLMHVGLARLMDPWQGPRWRRWLGMGIIATVDLFTTLLPPLLAWQHEEWHRAVLANRGMDSHNDIYDLNLLAEVVAVSHVKDEDLERLKARWPAEQVRLSTAGIEGNYELAVALERQAFFDDNPAFHRFLLPLLYLSNTFYMSTCASVEGNQTTDRQNVIAGADVPKRDFTGLDCVGWVYDLFRPDEPYAARGRHPSGVGIDRYRKLDHLSATERRYLDLQLGLSLLNFIDLQVVLLRGLEFARADGGDGLRVGFAVRHLPTSFGYVVRADLFLRRGAFKAFIQQQNYVNGERYFPGLDLSLLRYPLLASGPAPLLLSARLGVWQQPRQQRFDDQDGRVGGLGGLRLGVALHPRFEPFVEIEAKTAGWVAGIVHLERNLSVRTGVAARAF